MTLALCVLAILAVGCGAWAIIQTRTRIMSAIDDLTAQVSANTTVTGSALVLIQGLAAQLAAAGTDPAKLSALRSQLQNADDALAAAVAANTPAAAAAKASGATP